VLALETADRLAPFDSVPLLGATPHLLDRAASLLRERLAYAPPDHLATGQGPTTQNRRRSNLPRHWSLARGGHRLDDRIVARTLQLINNPHRARSAPQ
jgi:hypothetical protein